jgi:hypothetical protein
LGRGSDNSDFEGMLRVGFNFEIIADSLPIHAIG